MEEQTQKKKNLPKRVSPVDWFAIDNNEVWKHFACDPWRPSKQREYEINIEIAKTFMSLCRSARLLSDIHHDGTVHIVSPGPSLRDDKAALLAAVQPDHKIIAINAATQLIPRFDYVPWSERTSAVSTVWSLNWPKSVRIITAPYANPETLLRAKEEYEVYLFNIGTADGIGATIRQHWTENKSKGQPPLLELFTQFETTITALSLAYYMGFKTVYLWGIDYCWRDNEYFYALPSSPQTPEEIYDSMIKCHEDRSFVDRKKLIESVKPRPSMQSCQVIRNGVTVVPSRLLSKIGWTTSLMLLKAQRVSEDIYDYMQAGMEIHNMSKDGMLAQGETK